MLIQPFVTSYRAARKAVTPLAQRCATHFKRLVSPTSAAAPMSAAGPSPVPAPPAMAHGITAEHAAILATLEETARLGHVPGDAIVGRLHDYHCNSLAQDRQQLVVLEQELEGHLARLDARFPVPQPEPEKPPPVRVRKFGPISRDLRATAPGMQPRQ